MIGGLILWAYIFVFLIGIVFCYGLFLLPFRIGEIRDILKEIRDRLDGTGLS